MFAEWNRILNHLMFSGSFPLELGAMTPIFYAFREREMIQDLMESATGARMHHSYCRVGGLKDDLPRGFLKRSAEVLAEVRKRIAEFENADHGQRDHLRADAQRRRAPRRDARSPTDAPGPVLQASGVAMDPRKDEPYEKYGEVEFDVPVGTDRRLLRPAVGAGRADEAVLQHHRAVHGEAPGRPVPRGEAARRR